jgi:hypothetical protein
MLQRLRRRQDARRLAQADGEALIRDHGAEAYREARERERDVVLPDGTTHAGRTGALASPFLRLKHFSSAPFHFPVCTRFSSRRAGDA